MHPSSVMARSLWTVYESIQPKACVLAVAAISSSTIRTLKQRASWCDHADGIQAYSPGSTVATCHYHELDNRIP